MRTAISANGGATRRYNTIMTKCSVWSSSTVVIICRSWAIISQWVPSNPVACQKYRKEKECQGASRSARWFSGERHQYSGWKYRRQRRHQGSLQGVSKADCAQSVSASSAWSRRLQQRTAVLLRFRSGKKKKKNAFQVSENNNSFLFCQTAKFLTLFLAKRHIWADSSLLKRTRKFAYWY